SSSPPGSRSPPQPAAAITSCGCPISCPDARSRWSWPAAASRSPPATAVTAALATLAVQVTGTEPEPSGADRVTAAPDQVPRGAARELGLAEPGDGQEAAPADDQAAGKAGNGAGGAGLRAALFDVDGTLVDTNYLHTVAWWEAFARAGHDVPMASIHRAIGMGS